MKTRIIVAAVGLPLLLLVLLVLPPVATGILVGAMPGIGSLLGCALLLPLTFKMNPTSAIIMLAAIYYGNMYEPYVVMMQVMDEEAQGDITRSKKVLVKLFNTNPSLNPMEAFEKTAEKNGLYQALDIASVWLDAALKKAGKK